MIHLIRFSLLTLVPAVNYGFALWDPLVRFDINPSILLSSCVPAFSCETNKILYAY